MHCKKMIDLKAVTVATNYKEFEFEINRFLRDSNYQLESRQNARYQQVGLNDGKATERVVAAIENCLATTKA